MDYAEGKQLEQEISTIVTEQLVDIHGKLNWIIKAMQDTGVAPKDLPAEEKK